MIDTIEPTQGPRLNVDIIALRIIIVDVPQINLLFLLSACKKNMSENGKARPKSAASITGCPMVENGLSSDQESLSLIFKKIN